MFVQKNLLSKLKINQFIWDNHNHIPMKHTIERIIFDWINIRPIVTRESIERIFYWIEWTWTIVRTFISMKYHRTRWLTLRESIDYFKSPQIRFRIGKEKFFTWCKQVRIETWKIFSNKQKIKFDLI